MVIRGENYDCCSACSGKVTEAFRKDGWEFVKRALNEKGYVEDLSGLTEVQRTAEEAMADLDISEDVDIEDEEGEII